MRILFVENHRTFAETLTAELLADHQVVLVTSLAEVP